MFCGECGEPITPSARFCSACGAKSRAISPLAGRTPATSPQEVKEPETPAVSSAPSFKHNVPRRKIRWLDLLGWTGVALLFSLTATSKFLPGYPISDFVSRAMKPSFWFSFMFWSGLFCVWVRMGWRAALSARERLIAAVLTLVPTVALIALAVFLWITDGLL